ncbi:MAG: 16S rRNA (guanine(966)-N(2))-methyltransferase RsmD [Eubacterium sp.]|nr:16S rRNA (guanine(966)-N(2))-methyltransferase RsmD [Eubacterium sp.]
MRVIAGKARRIPLIAPPGDDTRPTTDRIKETLFNILQDELYDCRFLDLFAGSGGIGIEALSRGAAQAVFVESDRKAVRCIKTNLEKTKLADQADLRTTDVTVALAALGREGKPFDIIFADPPYRKDWEERLLGLLAESPIVTEDTLIIIESAIETETDYVDKTVYEIVRVKDYKSNRHIFIKRV